MEKTDSEVVRNSVLSASLLHMRDKIVEAAKTQSSSGWVDVKDPIMIDTIVSTYGNALNRKILNLCASKPHALMEILKEAKIPQTTGYRKTVYLIKGQFLFAYNEVQSGGKQIKRYMSTFKEVEFHTSEDKELIRVKFQDSFWQN